MTYPQCTHEPFTYIDSELLVRICCRLQEEGVVTIMTYMYPPRYIETEENLAHYYIIAITMNQMYITYPYYTYRNSEKHLEVALTMIAMCMKLLKR